MNKITLILYSFKKHSILTSDSVIAISINRRKKEENNRKIIDFIAQSYRSHLVSLPRSKFLRHESSVDIGNECEKMEKYSNTPHLPISPSPYLPISLSPHHTVYFSIDPKWVLYTVSQVNQVQLFFFFSLLVRVPSLGQHSLSWSAFPCVLRRRGI